MRSLSNKAINQGLQIMGRICAGLSCTPMHGIPLDLLLDVDNAQLLPARYFGVDLLSGLFGPCPLWLIQVSGLYGLCSLSVSNTFAPRYGTRLVL